MKNPLADPGITGVSSGASLAAIVVMLYLPHLYGSLPFIAFLGAIVSCIMVFALSWDNGLNSMRIILAGVAVNAIFVGATSLLSILNSDKIQGILLWINGSIAYKGWKEVTRSEEHTSELQSRQYLVCRLLLEKKNTLQS